MKYADGSVLGSGQDRVDSAQDASDRPQGRCRCAMCMLERATAAHAYRLLDIVSLWYA
jgi:hypothetical protein